jgi:hypothetical protein
MDRAALPVLKKLNDNPPADSSLYEFSMKQALETAQDNLAAAEEDLGKRGKEVEARDAKQKKELDDLMTPEERAAKKADDKKAAPDDKKQQRKAPTLKRPGEQ